MNQEFEASEAHSEEALGHTKSDTEGGIMGGLLGDCGVVFGI